MDAFGRECPYDVGNNRSSLNFFDSGLGSVCDSALFAVALAQVAIFEMAFNATDEGRNDLSRKNQYVDTFDLALRLVPGPPD
jgi:hypothetical protein